MAREEVIELIKKFISALRNNGIEINEAYLFGSYARNQATEESDIDVVLISPLFDENSDKYAGKIWMIATDLNYRIEPITIGAKRFITDDESPLIEMIKLEGIKIAA